jgi:hypothetical protein
LTIPLFALGHAQVICATCVGAGSGILEKKSFDAVLIDEASQATEIATLVPLIHGCQQLVLVGDHYQLPPTVASDAAKAEGLGLSLFERLVAAGVVPSLLDTQYRMHPAISQFPSDCFYGGAIADGIVAAARPAPRGFEWPRPEFPVAFLALNNAQEASDGTSKSNPVEANCVADIVRKLAREGGIPLLEIGVATPYAAQVRHDCHCFLSLSLALAFALLPSLTPFTTLFLSPSPLLLRTLLSLLFQVRLIRRILGHDFKSVECSSIDGFQGREKTVMVISTVRANRGGHCGFLADWCRTNVAITRARNGLIVVGNEPTLRSERRGWGPWLDWAWAHGVVVGEPARGAYDVEATRALATGKKAFRDRDQLMTASRYAATTGSSDVTSSGGGGATAAAAPRGGPPSRPHAYPSSYPPPAQVSVLLYTVTFYANLAHSLTRSP